MAEPNKPQDVNAPPQELINLLKKDLDVRKAELELKGKTADNEKQYRISAIENADRENERQYQAFELLTKLEEKRQSDSSFIIRSIIILCSIILLASIIFIFFDKSVGEKIFDKTFSALLGFLSGFGFKSFLQRRKI